jgi:hypothetical protein
MVNILSAAEAAEFLKCETDDPSMLLLLPQIDAYIKRSTGRDWAAENPIPQEAKSFARGLLVRWHEDPGVLNGSQEAVLTGSLLACAQQLRAMAANYFLFEGLPGVGLIAMPGVSEGDVVIGVKGKVNITGDQSEKFETVITWDGFLQQISDTDLEETYLEAHIIPAGEMP